MLPRHELWSALVQWQAFDGLKLTESHHRVDDELLELLAKDEVELAATYLATGHFVETVCPINTHQSDHREENSHTHSSRAFHVERVELVCFCPCVSTFKEAERIYRGIAKHERIAQFEGEPVVGIAPVARR